MEISLAKFFSCSIMLILLFCPNIPNTIRNIFRRIRRKKYRKLQTKIQHNPLSRYADNILVIYSYEKFTLLLLCCRRFRLFESGIQSLHLSFGRPGALLPAGILSLEIVTNIRASILLTCSSHFHHLPSTHSLIGWIHQDSPIC